MVTPPIHSVVTLLEDEKNYISKLYPIVWFNDNSCIVPHYIMRITITKHHVKGFALEYLKQHVIAAENSVFVKLCAIDERLGVLNNTHFLLLPFWFFAFDVIKNNHHIQVKKIGV